MKIYQVCHDDQSERQCSPSQEILNVKKIAIPQLAESRAFFHARLYDNSEYIGFTTYKHNEKFIDCIRIERITKELVKTALQNPDVKLIAFDPTNDFMKHINLYSKGMDKIITDFIKKEFDKFFQGHNMKTPLCNAFIMSQSEFQEYFKFFIKFLMYLEKVGYDLNEYNLDITVGDKNRGWAYFCEMLLSFYLNFKYPKFKIAYIDRAEKIHIK